MTLPDTSTMQGGEILDFMSLVLVLALVFIWGNAGRNRTVNDREVTHEWER
jgi:hypothetical protein